MHHTISYDTSNVIVADRKALNDIVAWLGKPSTFKILASALKSGCSFKMFELYANFAGIQGYPVHAMWRRYGHHNETRH